MAYPASADQQSTAVDRPPLDPAAGALRGILLFILVLGMGGAATELILLQHYEDRNQLIPLAMFAAAGLALIGRVFFRGAFSLRVVQMVMLLFIAAGGLGVILHFQASAQFQREMDPTLGAGELFWNAIRTQAPPALAPGVMVQLGLIGLAYTYRHPALLKRPVDGE